MYPSLKRKKSNSKGLKTDVSKRIHLLDLFRTIAMVFMVIHHVCYDLSMFSIIPFSCVQGLPLRMVSYISATLFMLCSGVSSRLSRSNVRRGFQVLICACVVSIVTSLMDRPVVFGILHFFGVSMILYGFFEKPLSRIKGRAVPLLYLILFIVTNIITDKAETSLPFLFPLGFTADGFYSSDYYPLLPWIFVFLTGAWLGGLIISIVKNRDSRYNKLLYTPLPSALTWPGRHSLVIYMVHQPVIYFAVMGIAALLGKA